MRENDMVRWARILGDTRTSSALGRYGNQIKGEHKELDKHPSQAKPPKSRGFRQERPAHVQQAVLKNDSAECSRLGKVPRKKKVTKQEAPRIPTIMGGDAVRKPMGGRHYFSSVTMTNQANEDICPVD